MFNSVRQRMRRLSGLEESTPRLHDARLQLRLPNPYGGSPWLTATLALSSTPHGHGETVRLRAHVDGCLRRPHGTQARAVLPGRQGGRRSLMRHGRDAAASLVRGVVRQLPAEQLAPLTSRRWRSWLDIQLSTSPLDGGADALMPEPLRGIYGGGLPRADTGEPRIGVWSGPAGGPAGGVAHLALLQLDERDLGCDRRERGGSGFNLNASIAQVIEPDTGFDTDR